jgi:4-carboxymuconolactone decarboxylase
MALVPYVDESNAEPAAAEALDRVLKRRGFISMVNQVLANSPSALNAFDDFSRHINSESPLDKPLRELLILRITQLVGNKYEWRRHIPIALDAGVPQGDIEGLSFWRDLDLEDRQRAALALAEEVVAGWTITDGTKTAVTDAFEPNEVVELVLTTGWHLLVATLILTLGLIEDDEPVEPLVPFVSG